MPRGKIIVIDGTDGSGKATQTDLLFNRLNLEGFPSEKISFPRYETPAGRIVAQAYLGKQGFWGEDKMWFGDPDKLDPKIASLFYAADRALAAPYMEEKLEKGINLVTDRYSSANMGHQGGKLKTKNEREQMWFWLQNLEYQMLGVIPPDLTIILYTPVEIALELRRGREAQTNTTADGHESNLDHLKRAEETYLQMAEFFNYWPIIQCVKEEKMRSREEVHEEIFSLVQKYLFSK